MNSFDRFADWVEEKTASATFFVICCLLVLLWAPSLPLFGKLDTWQLVINTTTTIVTFLLVALQANSNARFAKAVNARLEEIIDKLDGAADPVQDMGQKTLT